MVFHEIDSVVDINSPHRIIIYYIEGKCQSVTDGSQLHNSMESSLRMLEKKNDDLLIVKVSNDNDQLTKFQDLYKADISGLITLFVVNNEGIPLTSQHVFEEKDITVVIFSICSTCELKFTPVMASEIQAESIKSCTNISPNSPINDLESNCSFKHTKILAASSVDKTENDNTNKLTSKTKTPSENETCSVNPLPNRTLLQIRLPDGSREKQFFCQDALLSELRSFISITFKLKEFDLKTYNHQNFSEDEYDMTLKELELYPNGVVIVVPKNSSIVTNNGRIGPMIRYGWREICTKFTYTFSYIQGLLFNYWNRFFSSNSRSTGGNYGRNRIQQNDESRPARPNDQSSFQRKSKSATKSSSNIHTLKRKDDSDDENNRYNGNSTQQK